MAVSVCRGLASTDIRCPDCNHVRTVSERQARRWQKGEYTGRCSNCRRGHRGRSPRDSDYAYWLRLYGVEIPKGQKALDHVVASGVPPELARFARQVFPT